MTTAKATCTGPLCARPTIARGYCQGHYAQYRSGRTLQPLRQDVVKTKSTCEFAGCEKPVKAHGYCSAHYGQLRRGKTLKPLRLFERDATCIGPDCARPVVARGYCHGHYKQWQEGRVLENIRGKVTVMDRDAAGRKQCQRCFLWVEISGFASTDAKDCPDGLRRTCARCSKDRDLWTTYRIRVDQYEAMLKSQNGGCYLCQGSPASGRAMHVDHDHACCPGNVSCGSCVRSLLCDLCNMTLGSARDDADLLRRMATYVEEHRNKSSI